ncbi:MAG TPA: hypothetical protein VGC88_01355, partial [Terriglobales bacterium]
GDVGAIALDAAGFVPLLGPAAMVAGHEEAKHLLHQHDDQSTRVMLEYMVAAGYDLREAAIASRILDGPTESRFAKDPDADKATALVMERIRKRYAGVVSAAGSRALNRELTHGSRNKEARR